MRGPWCPSEFALGQGCARQRFAPRRLPGEGCRPVADRLAGLWPLALANSIHPAALLEADERGVRKSGGGVFSDILRPSIFRKGLKSACRK
jgi:hypothetical protein